MATGKELLKAYWYFIVVIIVACAILLPMMWTTVKLFIESLVIH